MARAKLAVDAKTYIVLETTETEVKTAKDQVTLNLSKNEADVSPKGSKWDLSRGTTKIGSVDFQLLCKAGDAIFTALMDSFLNDTPLEMYILDGDFGTAGAAGLHADFEVMQMNRTEARKDALVYDVNIKITDGETEGVPEWYIDAGA